MGQRSSVGVGILLLVTGAMIAGCGVAGAKPDTPITSTTVSGSAADLPSDILAAGMEVAPLTLEGTISLSQALDIAARDHGPRYDGGTVDAYLVSLTDPGTLRGKVPIQDRAVWLIRYSGLAIPYTGPITADGTPAEGGTISHAYVVLDAITGQWLYTEETD